MTAAAKMPPLDWELVQSYPLDDVNDELTDQLFEQLLDYDPSEENDLQKIKRLFEVTRSIMQIKALQADVAVEELEQMAKREGIIGARKERELQLQIDGLKKQLARQDSDSYTGSEVQRLNEEIQVLQKKNDKLLEAMKEKENYIDRLKQTNETQLNVIAESEKHASSLRAEIEQLKEELAIVHDQQEKMDADIELSREQRYKEQAEKIKMKNKQIHRLMDENKELEDENTHLKEEISELQNKLRETVENLKRVTSDCVSLNEALVESNNRIVELEKIEHALRAELDEIQAQNRLRLDIDDEIMDMVTQRIEEWKRTYMPQEVFDLRVQVKELEKQLAMQDRESEQLYVTKLKTALQEKEEEIQILKSQLEQATKDMESNLTLIDELKSKLGGVGLPLRKETDTEQDHILKLETLLVEKTAALNTATQAITQMEEEAKRKDKEMTEIVARMRQYEMGVYGLPEAVAEIKECRTQIRLRDKHVEELIQQVNQAELLIGELLEENEDFREQLGLELKAPAVSESSRQKYQTRWQKERSLNIQLQAELEKLEDERIALKEELRKLRKGNQQSANVRPHEQTIPGVDSRIRELEDELKSYQEIENKYKKEYSKLKTENDDLRTENKELQQGMKEILHSIKEQDEKADVTIHSPALDRLLQFIEIKQVHGNYDATLTLKSEVDHLKGHNDELRLEVKRLRQELLLSQKEASDLKHQVQTLQDTSVSKEQTYGKERSVKVGTESSTLVADAYTQPETLDDTCSQLLQEVQKKDELISMLRNELEANKKELEAYTSVIPHVRPDYQEFFKEKEKFEKAVLEWKEEKLEFEEERQAEQIKAQEWENLMRILNSEEDQQKKSIGELSRKVTIMKMNEGALKRRYLAMSDLESSLRKENSRLKREFCEFESSVIEQLGYFQRQNESLKFKLRTFQNQVGNTVTLPEFERLNKLYSDLNLKHAELLEQYTRLQERLCSQKKLERKLKEANNENAVLKLQLENVTSKTKPKEVIEEDLSTKDDGDSTTRSISLLEMQLTNEYQKHKLALLKAEQLSETVQTLEVRNRTLEENLEELTKTNIALQNENRSLNQELSKCVTEEAHKQSIKRINELEGIEIVMKQEIGKLTDMVDIARGQVRMVEQARVSQEKEIETLRKQLLELQSTNDDKSEKGHLLHQLLTSQKNESILSEQLEKFKNDAMKLQAQVLRLQQKCDNQEERFLESKMQYENKVTSLSNIVSEFQQKYLTSITTRRHEKLLEDIAFLRKENASLRDQLDEVEDKYCNAESTIAGLELKVKILEEMIEKAESDSPQVQRVVKQLASLESARRTELRAISRAEIKEEEYKHQKSVIKTLEKRLDELEIENATLETDLLEKEMRLQQIELDTSKFLRSSDQTESSTEHAEKSYSSAVDQLEVSMLKRKLDILEEQLKKSEQLIVERDKIITILRTQIPSTEERQKSADGEEQETLMGEMSRQAIKVAQTTIECLQARLLQKDESIACYRELLNEARIDYNNQLKQNEKELQALQEQLRSRDSSSLSAIHNKMSEILSKPRIIVELKEREDRISQLEEMLSQEEFTVNELTEKLDVAIVENGRLRSEVERLNFEVQKKTEDTLKEKEAMAKEASEATEKVKILEDELTEKTQAMGNLEKEMKELRQELSTHKQQQKQQQSSKPGPDSLLRGTVDNLKTQLVEKEKQLQALSKALTDLKADMVASIQGNLRSDEPATFIEERLQRIVDQKTSELQAKVLELESVNQKMKRDVKGHKDEIDFLNDSIKYLEEELNRKSSMIDRLVSERNEMQRKVEGMRATMQQQETSTKHLGDSREVDQLRRQIIQLEEQLQRKQPAEKPYDQSREQVARWEESKKWQRTTEQQRAKLKEKQKEVELLQRNLSRLREQVTRTDREKSVLENKVKNLSQLIAVAGTTAKDAERLELQRKNVELEKELHSLRMRLDAAGSGDTFDEMKVRNKVLLDKIEELEKEIVKLRYEKDIKKMMPHMSAISPDDVPELKQKVEELDLEVLKLTEENFNLRLQLEQARTSNPQLQHQISLLEKELEILKSEGDGLPESDEPCDHDDDHHFRLFSSVLNSDLEDLGTAELKLMILALRKGIRKLQVENVKMKKERSVNGPSPGSRKDTSDRERTAPSGQTPRSSDWREVAEQRISRVLQENTKLARDLKVALQKIDKQAAEIEVLTLEKQRMTEKVDLLMKEVEQYEKTVLLRLPAAYK